MKLTIEKLEEAMEQAGGRVITIAPDGTISIPATKTDLRVLDIAAALGIPGETDTDAILRQALATIQKLSGDDEHPENRCEECGGRNVTWFTVSTIWNRVANSSAILCPICFIQRAEADGFRRHAWKITPEFDKAKT